MPVLGPPPPRQRQYACSLINLHVSQYRGLKGTVSRDFLLQDFLHESSSPHGDIGKSRCTTSINDNGGKYWAHY
jgi:hypothetical protein